MVQTIAGLLKARDADGAKVIMNKNQNYASLISNELGILENLSDNYSSELKVVSNFIRINIFEKEDDKFLYEVLHRINQIMKMFSDAIGAEVLWCCSTVIEYAVLVCRYEGKWVSDKLLNKLVDDVQIANAKKIIDRQWNDVLASDDEIGKFMKVFDDVFTSAIKKSRKNTFTR